MATKEHNQDIIERKFQAGDSEKRVTTFSPQIFRLARDECRDISSIFYYARTKKPVNVLNLACGSFYGAEKFTKFFSHKESTLYGLDVVKQDRIAKLEELKILEYIHCNLKEKPSQECLWLLRDCEIWISRYACSVTFRIMKLFDTYACNGAKLYVLDCSCTFEEPNKSLIHLDEHLGFEIIDMNTISCPWTRKNDERELLYFIKHCDRKV